MNDGGRIFGPSGHPVSSAQEGAAAQVQPAADQRRRQHRLRGYYLMVPKAHADNLEATHAFLAAVERAPASFTDFLMLLIMQGAQVFIPHQMAEFEAEQAELKAKAVAWAQEVLAKPDASEEDRKKAYDILAAVEMDRAAAEQASGGSVSPMPDERDRNIIINEVEKLAAEEAEVERQAKETLERALAETPEPPKVHFADSAHFEGDPA